MGYLIKSEVLDAIHEDLCTSLACYDDSKTKNIVEFCYQSMEREIDNLKQYRLDTVEEQEAVNRWIPCSEKLPDDIKDCLVTLENGAVFQASYSSIGQEFRVICWHGIERFSADNKVVAWQPLPQPYNSTENWKSKRN